MLIKKNGHSNVYLKFLCDAKLITPLFIFLMFLDKIENENIFLYLYILELSSFEYDCLVELHVKKGKRQRWGVGHWWATFVWQTTVDSMWKNLCYLAVAIKFKFFRSPAKSFVLKSWKKNMLHLVSLN